MKNDDKHFRLVIADGQAYYNLSPESPKAAIEGFTQSEAEVEVATEIEGLSHRQASCLILAACGLSLERTAKHLNLSPLTVKAHLGRGYASSQINGRSAVARHMLERGYFNIQQSGMPLRASSRELDILHMISFGHTNSDVAAALWRSPLTIKSHLQRVSNRNAVISRERLVMRGLLAGQIQYSPTS